QQSHPQTLDENVRVQINHLVELPSHHGIIANNCIGEVDDVAYADIAQNRNGLKRAVKDLLLQLLLPVQHLELAGTKGVGHTHATANLDMVNSEGLVGRLKFDLYLGKIVEVLL